MRKPVQVSDSLMELLDVQQSPSLTATFVAHSPRGPFLRPLRQVQIKVLFDLARGHYWLVYRGFHAILLTAALLLFVRALRVSTWVDFAAAVFALTVLTGLHTFRGTVREAFPINHFLETLVFCLAALNFSQSRGGWWVDALAVANFVVAALTLESGVLVWVVVVACWLAGCRGVSSRGIAVMTIALGGYLWLRFGVLSMASPGLDIGRDTGIGTRMVGPEELAQRFGQHAFPLYVYNVVASFLSVLFSDPDRGVFHTVRTFLAGQYPERLYIATIPSLLTTLLIGWVAALRVRGRAPNLIAGGDALLVVFAAVLIANSVLSYAYTKPEIISVAGGFYALAAFVAIRFAVQQDGLIDRLKGHRLRYMAACTLVGALAAAWAFRSLGVHHMIQTQAFRERLEWARLDPDRLAERSYRSDASARALAAQLRRDALELRLPNPALLPGWADDWWGE